MRLWNSRRPKVYRRRIIFEQLEERIVLDAAVTPQPTNVILDHPETLNTQQADHQDAQAQANTQPVVAPPPLPTPAGEVFHQDLNVVLVSNALDKIPEISQAAMDAAKVITYDAQHDNLVTIVGVLQDVSKVSGQKIDNLIVIGHGAENAMRIGTDRIDFSNVGQFSADLTSLGQAMSEQAQIQLFTCSLAKDASGKAFVDSIAKLTGADVYASDDNSGGAKGDWTLEYGSDKGVAIKSLLDTQYLTNIRADLTYAPELNIIGIASGTENSTVDLSQLISVSDHDSDEVLTVTLTAVKGFTTLNATADNGAILSGADTNTLTIEGSRSAVNGTLAHLTGALVQDWDSSDQGQASVLVQVSDSRGHNDGSDSSTLYASIASGPVQTSDGVYVLAVSSAIQQADQLANAAAPGVITVTYDPTLDSPDSILAKIETVLHGEKADSIAFATYDQGPGQFLVTGDYLLNSSTLITSTELQHFWKGVGDLVNENGRIDLLACGLVSNDTGTLLLSELESLTLRNFAASSDPTGNAQYGGDWVLESDGIDIAPIYFNHDRLSQFPGVLFAPPVAEGQSVSVNEDGSLTITVTGVVGSQPADTDVLFEVSTPVTSGSLSSLGPVIQGTPGHYSQQFLYTPGHDYNGTDSFQFIFKFKTWSGWTSGTSFSGYDSVNSVALGDVKRDGNLDVVLGRASYSYDNLVYLGNGNGTFTSGGSLPNSAAHYTQTIALGDVNGDGKLDVVEGNWAVVNKVYLGKGDGTFWNPTNLETTAYNTTSIVLGDVDGDLDLDVIVGNSGTTNKVYLNNGSGTFTYTSDIGSASATTKSIALGDLNGDGKLDVIAGNEYYASKTYLGNGDGNFTYKSDIGNSNAYTQSIALGDLNGDAKLDVIAGNSGGVASKAYLGNGDGTFTYTSDIGTSTDNHIYDIALGDVNGDGKLDVVQANGPSYASKVYLGNGDGTFTYRNSIGSSGDYYSYAMALGDVNNDDTIDVVQAGKTYLNQGSAAEFSTSSPATVNITVTTANDAPTASGNTVSTLEDTPYVFQFADFNFSDVDSGDTLHSVKITGLPDRGTLKDDGTVISSVDYVISSENLSLGKLTFVPDGDEDGPGYASFHYRVSDGTVYSEDAATMTINVTAVDDPPTVEPQSVSLNEDGTLTITVVGYDADQPPVTGVRLDVTSAVGNGTLTAIGSVTQDAVDHTKYTQQYLYTPSGNYNGSDSFHFTFQDNNWQGFGAGTSLSVGPDSIRSIALGDLNSDGKLDMVIGRSAFGSDNMVYRGNGDGTFTYIGSLSSSAAHFTRSIVMGDVNGDLKLDVVEGNAANWGMNYVYLGNGDGTFQPAIGIENNHRDTTSMALGNLNGDGNLDMVVAFYGDFTKIYLGNGDGTFAENPTSIGNSTDFTSSIAMADVSGDGKLDIIAGNDGPWSSSKVYLGNGDGTFTYKSDIGSTLAGTKSIVLGDVNGDLKLDLIAGNSGGSAVSKVYLGNGDGTFTYKSDIGTNVANLYAIELGDVNGDGKLDVVQANGTSSTSNVYLGNGDGNFTYRTYVGPPSNNIYANAMALGYLNNTDTMIDVVQAGMTYLNQGLNAIPSSPATVNITVNAVNDTPTDIALGSSSISENSGVGALVGTLSSTDPDTGDSHSYTLVEPLSYPDNASFTILGNQLKTAADFNYEAKSSYSIKVQTNDGHGGTFEKTFTINVGDVYEAPPYTPPVYTPPPYVPPPVAPTPIVPQSTPIGDAPIISSIPVFSPLGIGTVTGIPNGTTNTIDIGPSAAMMDTDIQPLAMEAKIIQSTGDPAMVQQANAAATEAAAADAEAVADTAAKNAGEKLQQANLQEQQQGENQADQAAQQANMNNQQQGDQSKGDQGKTETAGEATKNIAEKTGSEKAAALVGAQGAVSFGAVQNMQVMGGSPVQGTGAFTGTIVQVDLSLAQGTPTSSFSEYLGQTAIAAKVELGGFSVREFPANLPESQVQAQCKNCTGQN